MTPAQIQTARKRLKMTQAQFGKALGMNTKIATRATYVRRLELGHVKAKGPVVLIIKQLLQEASP